MILIVFSIIAFVLAAFPVGMFFANLSQFRTAPLVLLPPSVPRGREGGPISILIPARNEERSIRECVEAALASEGVTVQVIVLDDHSTDATAQIVRSIALLDARLRVEPAPPLPVGWCGKQHACDALSRLATHDHLLFIDADLRLSPDAARRAIASLNESGAGLVSAFPRQQTGSILERLLIPLIHVVLLGYLPLREMRRSLKPAMSAGCGQFFLTRRAEYERAGGHAAIRASLHDGITLPRAYRKVGLSTDIFDGTDTSTCHMYRSNGECWRGLSKNAIEGLASPKAIAPWTILLIGGHVLPFVLAAGLIVTNQHPAATIICAVAVAGLYAMRAAAAVRFRESSLGVVFHPVGVLILVAIQWTALIRHLLGRPSRWKDRQYSVGLEVAPSEQAV